jgi:hypothetical protein
MQVVREHSALRHVALRDGQLQTGIQFVRVHSNVRTHHRASSWRTIDKAVSVKLRQYGATFAGRHAHSPSWSDRDTLVRSSASQSWPVLRGHHDDLSGRSPSQPPSGSPAGLFTGSITVAIIPPQSPSSSSAITGPVFTSSSPATTRSTYVSDLGSDSTQ